MYERVVRWSRPTAPEASPPGSDRRACDSHAPARFSLVSQESRTSLRPVSETDTTNKESSTKRDSHDESISGSNRRSWNCLGMKDRSNRPRRGVGVALQLGVNGRFGRRNRRPQFEDQLGPERISSVFLILTPCKRSTTGER
jgi:hypothetical protein